MAAPILVGIPEIADLASVSRPAVSNWRKRYRDFPEPRLQSDSGVLFDLSEVEAWLLDRGKIDQPIPPGSLVWRFADALRGGWPAATLVEFVSSWLCYLEACERAEQQHDAGGGRRIDVPEPLRWTKLQTTIDGRLATELRRAAREIEARNPALVDLLRDLAPDPFPEAHLVRAFVGELVAATDDITPRFALFEEAQQRGVDLGGPEAAEYVTPDSLARLMSLLGATANDDAVIVDPACGAGFLLLMAAVGDRAPEGQPRFVGVDINVDAVRHARARFFLYGIGADLSEGDSLRLSPTTWPRADTVLVDPPIGLKNWGDAELYRSPRWLFGAPPPGSADMAWAQLAVSMLQPNGRAVIVLPAGSLFRGGREAVIRENLIRSGVLEAIVELPARMRRNTSIPLAIWVCGRAEETAAPRPVLLIDASSLGTSGRSVHDLHEDDVDMIVSLVDEWRRTGAIPGAHSSLAVAVERNDLLASNCNLSPRRHLPPASRVPAEELEARSRSAWAAVTAAARAERLPAVPPGLWERGPHQPSSVRLGDVAELIRTTPSAREESGTGIPLQRGDLLLFTTPTGFTVTRADEGDSAFGHHVIVIRPRPLGPVTADWLYLWAGTTEFQSLLERHARGSTIRSLALADLAMFELVAPNVDRQTWVSHLVDELSTAIAAQRELVAQLQGLLNAEQERLYEMERSAADV